MIPSLRKHVDMLKAVEVPFSGHPDKICDQIVDGILDEYLKRDPKSRLNIQALGSHGMLMIGGVADSRADFDVATLAQNIYTKIGYVDGIEPFVNIERASEDLAKIAVKGGAQGTVITHGYATKETREMLPRALVYAQAIARRITDLRVTDARYAFLLPDGKVQVAADGDKVKIVNLAVQHTDSIDRSQIQRLLLEEVLTPILGDTEGMKLSINFAGNFTIGGFMAASGSSGRKEVSDTYGGLLPWGGSSFSGKDPHHPARAGLYMSRFAAKELVKKGVAGNVLISVGYGLGQKEPVFLEAVSGTGQNLKAMVEKEYDFRIEAIVERLQLATPHYGRVAIHGQFGRDGLPWEDV